MGRQLIKWIPVFIIASACVDPISFESSAPSDILVIDGMINDGPGPYRVKISRALSLNVDSTVHAPVSHAIVKLHDDGGAVEDMTEEKAGEYSTAGVIRGTIGRSYYITIELPDGTKFESDPEMIMPAGEIFNISHVFEARTVTKPYGVFRADVLNLLIDADAATRTGDLAYMRWRFTGTYKVQTNPELHTTLASEFIYKTPYACSGYVVDPALNGGVLRKRTECTCCTCWVRSYETSPQVFDTQLILDGQFRNVKVGEVPVNGVTFFDKYLVEIEQMKISRKTYEFFKLIKTQKEQSSNLFQPAQGRLGGNIRSSDPNVVAVGLFWAASVQTKSIYIRREDLPYVIEPAPFNPEPCDMIYANAMAVKPDYWDE